MARSTNEMEKGGQAAWLVRLYEKTAGGIRRHGLPARSEGVLSVQVPTLMRQARIMRKLDILPPGQNTPSGVIDFDD